MGIFLNYTLQKQQRSSPTHYVSSCKRKTALKVSTSSGGLGVGSGVGSVVVSLCSSVFGSSAGFEAGSGSFGSSGAGGIVAPML